MFFFLNESTKKTALSSRNEEAGDAEDEKKANRHRLVAR